MLRSHIQTVCGNNNASMTDSKFSALMSASQTRRKTKADSLRADKSIAKMKKVAAYGNLRFNDLIDEYQTGPDRVAKVVNLRNLKIMLSVRYSLRSDEVDNLIQYWDNDGNGFINTIEIQQKMLV